MGAAVTMPNLTTVGQPVPPSTFRRRVRRDFTRASETYAYYGDFQLFAAENLFRHMVKIVEPGAKLVDLGSGTGNLWVLQERHRQSFPTVALDISGGMCRKSRAAGAEQIIQADIQDMPLRDASMDVAFSSLALQWVPDWKKAFSEIRRVLKTGGILCLTSLGQDTLVELRESLQKAGPYMPLLPFRALSDLVTVLMQHGFQIIDKKQKSHVRYYSSPKHVFEMLKGLGSTHKGWSTTKHMKGKDWLKRVESTYAQDFGTEGGVPVTWELHEIIARKF